MKKSNKRYRVKSKFRFITFIVVTAFLTIGLFTAVTGLNVSTALTKQDTVKVTVESGDTLWNIAKEYKSNNTDTRKAVYEICHVNDIDASDLTPGMVLVIPSDI
jgi:nucleoid-associated protein YgaU